MCKLQRILENVLKICVIFFKGIMPKIDERDFRENVMKLMEVAGEALDGFQIQESLDAIDGVVGTLNNVFGLVKIQQERYIDLGIRFALAQGNIKMLHRQMAVSSG